MKRYWPHLRAVLIAFHGLTVLALALPTPGSKLSRQDWREDTVQLEFQAWTQTLRGLGLEITAAQLEQKAWNVAGAWVRLRSAMVAPFRPYADAIGLRQPWRMFVAPDRHPTRLEVDIRSGGKWRTIYRARSREHDWQATRLDHDRVRSAVFRYGWPKYRKPYRRFARWLAVQAFRDFPRARKVRVRFFRSRTLAPQEVRDGQVAEGVFQHELTWTRKQLR